MYKLFCDSNCELWHTVVERLGLNVIRMPYIIENNEYFYDLGKDTDFKAFYSAMRGGTVPKTSALNEYDYIEYFEPVLAAGYDVLYITFSHAMSATFMAMDMAVADLKKKYPDREIRAIDTKTISLGAGFIVYYAALKYGEGATMDELTAYVNELIPRTATYFAVDNFTYLYRGGRVSGISRVIGNLFGIKPILYFNEEGKIVTADKQKGFKKAVASLLSRLEEKGDDADKYKIFVLQADCEEVAQAFVADIKAKYPAADVVLQPVGPVIGSHCGPGTLGLIFHAKER